MAAASSSAASSSAASSSAARESESDVESDVTVAQHVHGDQELDEAHWDAEGGGDDGDGGGDEVERDSDGEEACIPVTRSACGQGELFIVTAALASSRGGKSAKVKPQQYGTSTPHLSTTRHPRTGIITPIVRPCYRQCSSAIWNFTATVQPDGARRGCKSGS
mmetsp:Transcript_25652/g.59856  ORF Transcript_25652/g.59856 Transcript_25652/m.59856 type:complete len:163 (-) Transcript_25652:3193-3681(-)